MHGDTQTAAILALRFDLLPESLRASVADRLVSDIRARNDHLSTGFVGVSHLLPVLDDAGHADLALRLLHQDTFPSWLFSVRHGATTIWERWDGWTPETGPHPDWGMNSFNHYSLGSCGQWMFDRLAGIACELSTPGYARALIRPCIDPALTFVKATRRTIRGDYACAWRVDAGKLHIDVTIPTNAIATVHVPAAGPEHVHESGQPIAQAKDVRLQPPSARTSTDAGTVVLDVGSGTYHFTCPRP